MRRNTFIIFVGVVIIAVLVAGCTTQPQPLPTTPTPTTPIPVPLQPSPPITGTWTLVSVLAGMGASNVLPETTITATFSADGTVSGSSGCNSYVATYQVGDMALTIGTPVTTMMSCNSPAGIMNQETVYLSNLQGAASYRIDGNLLMVYDGSGKTLLTYQRGGSTGSPPPFAGIPWNLEMYRQSSGSNSSVIPTTKVTAFFSPAGTLTGSAGCNSYTGTFITSGSSAIAIGPLSTTRMFCGEQGVMDQETSYLILLRTATSYEMTADGFLHLKNPAGKPVLVYSR